MNEPDESLSDDTLQELLKPFREATAPATAQIANRLAVQQALSKQAGRCGGADRLQCRFHSRLQQRLRSSSQSVPCFNHHLPNKLR